MGFPPSDDEASFLDDALLKDPVEPTALLQLFV
jgi:hypothetical protein